MTLDQLEPILKRRGNITNYRHGCYKTKEYQVWRGIKDRCLRKNAANYPRYGGIGITVCERWMKFENFIADMGYRPSDNHMVERIDNSRGYEPGNCRWATLLEQANNRRTNHFVDYRGGRMTIADAARAAGSLVTREIAAARIKHGWSVESAVETPRKYTHTKKAARA